MKLIFISPLRYPSEKAGSAFSMKSCEVFAGDGIDVELWVPRRLNKLHRENAFLYHGVRKNFRIVRLPVIDLMSWIPSYFITAASFAISVFFYALWRQARDAVYYSHEEFALFLLTFISKRTVYEIHDFPSLGCFQRWLLKRISAIVTTNNWKKNKLAELFNYPPEKIFAIPNAVAVSQFAINVARNEARQKLGLPLDKRIAVYTGHLYGWKGVDTLLEASQLLRANCVVYFVGGTEKDVEEFKIKNKKLNIKDNAVIVGHRSHDEIPIWLRAADVLVLPNTAKEEISAHYTSPMKLFEYMASGRPIIASDLASVREVFNETLGTFFTPDDPVALSVAIQRVLEYPEEAEIKAAMARRGVATYTWEIRAKCISAFLASS